MNLLEQNADGTPGYYGYPRCWSVGELNGYEPGTQMYQPGFESTTTDLWCQEYSRRPLLNFGAHQAPLDIKFWNSTQWGSVRRQCLHRLPRLVEPESARRVLRAASG